MHPKNIAEAQKNQLLNGLSKAALSRLLPDVDLQSIKVRKQIAEREKPIQTVYFPISCVLSTVAHGAAGRIVEVATLGNEGMAGVSIFLGVTHSSTLETFCQVPGDAMCMSVSDFKKHLQEESRLHEIMGAYTQALLTQISQSSACNRMHTAEERCARWLLMSHDRVHRDEFELTQEFLGQMLGVRRATVGGIAAELQEKNVIRYIRGRITVLNRKGLEELACECYEIIRREYTRLLPNLP